MDARQAASEIQRALVALDGGKVTSLMTEALSSGCDPAIIVTEGVAAGLKRLGDLFEEEEIFLPELILGGKIGMGAVEVLKPLLPMTSEGGKGLFLIGTVKDDVHEIGKNVVRLLATIAGYEVVDLGKDVATETFIEKVRELKPRYLGLSALLSTTLVHQRNIIEALTEAGLRDSVKVLVGGAPVHKEWADRIGADGYAENAVLAVRELDRLA